MTEEYNVSRPPLVEGDDFSYWKAKMKIFLNSQDEYALKVIDTAWHVPTLGTNELGVIQPKSESITHCGRKKKRS